MKVVKYILLGGICALVGCDELSQTNGSVCQPGTILAGTRCIPGGSDQIADAGMSTQDSAIGSDATVIDASAPLSLPLTVDDWFGPSGYMGDGEMGGIATIACPERSADALGSCHGFEWTPGALGWAGVFWQYPDGNWGEQDGFLMPQGAQSVRFTAWGATGSEVVSFGVGMGDVDGFSATRSEIALSSTPTEFTIDLAEIEYTQVVGGFSWSMDAATTPQVIFVDNIHWSAEPAIEEPEPMPTEPELPLYVDDWYAPSGYMGDGGSDGIAHAPCDDEQRSMRTCHRFTWTPGLQGWAGVFWQYPDGNWGTEPGLMVPQGAQSIRFLAWGDEGGETISFGAGMEDADGFARSTAMTLTTEPTEYIVSLDGAEYTSVAGGFVWTADGADAPVTFRVADIRWSTEAAPVVEPETPAGELPVDVGVHFIPGGYMGEVMSVNPVDCPMATVDGACFGFEWTPTGMPGWAGVVWQYPDGNWGAQPGLAIDPGATAIQFTAWGQMGGESVTFGAGYGANSADGFDVSTGEIVLNAEPTQYEIPLDGVTYETVASGFRWTTESPTDTTFYVGAIRWIP